MHPIVVNLLPQHMKQRLKDGVCIQCGQPFTNDNVHSNAGWREVKITSTCEDCFDALFADMDED